MAKGMKSWTWWIIGAICWLIVGRQAQAVDPVPVITPDGNAKPVSKKPSLAAKVREKVNKLLKEYLTGDTAQRNTAMVALGRMKNETGIVLRERISANNKVIAEYTEKIRQAKNDTKLQASLMQELNKVRRENNSLNQLNYRLFKPVAVRYGIRPRPRPVAKYGVRPMKR